MSTGTGGIGAEGALSGTDPQPPCSLHSCLDSVQLQENTMQVIGGRFFMFASL